MRLWHILHNRLPSLFLRDRRDARGTGLVDDAIRDILYALRGFRRAPLVAVTIVTTVALGLGLVTVAFTLLNMFLFRVDQVPRVDEMFAVERPRGSDGERQRFTIAEFDALRRETDIFAGVYAMRSDVDGRVDGRKVFGTFVTGNVFQVLDVTAARGRGLTPADDEPPWDGPSWSSVTADGTGCSRAIPPFSAGLRSSTRSPSRSWA